MSVLALIITALSCLIAVVLPWAGVLFYYITSVGQIQSMWPVAFADGRVSLMISAATLLGLCGATALKMINYRILLYPHSLLMMLLCLWVNLSVNNSAFLTQVVPAPGDLSQAEQLSIFNKIMVFYFAATLLINTRKKLEWLIYTFAGILVYYTAWANKVYLTGEFWLFGDNGRLGGPIGSVYFDENNLAMLFVMASPVLYYLGIARQNIVLRYAIWLIIPLSWHALFLTGSRGGLVALCAVCVYIFFRSFNKKASLGIAVGLVLAVIYQSGHLLQRVDETIDNANTVEASVAPSQKALDPRLISWQVGTEIMRDHPVFGVGVANFIKAFPDYSNTNPHVAHNTFLQFAANCGILTGLIFLWHFWMRFKTVFTRPTPDATFHGGLHRDYLEDLLNCIFFGFFVVAMFLDLMLFEILYLVFLLGFVKYSIDQAVVIAHREPKSSIYRTGQHGNLIGSHQGQEQRETRTN